MARRSGRKSDGFGSISYWQTIVNRCGSLRIQDLVLVMVCLLAMYLLRARDSYILQPVWRLHPNTTDDKLLKHSPAPIITDLDGDGQMEVVAVTGQELIVCTLPVATGEEARKMLPELKVKHSVNISTLISSEGGGGESFPVALQAGYLSRSAQSSSRIRTQVIVVVLDNWSVACFDHQLTLLWSRSLVNTASRQDSLRSDDQFSIKSMGLLIIPHSLKRGQNGTVIVGGSQEHRNHNARLKSLRAIDLPSDEYELDKMADSVEDIYTHFSTVALGGSDGTILWHHLPKDFVRNTTQIEEVKRAIHWKLALQRGGQWHVGESHWTKYFNLINKHLPHSWINIGDTRFDISDLSSSPLNGGGESVMTDTVKDSSTNSDESLLSLQDIVDLNNEHIVGLQYGGMRPHSRHEHVKHPSVVVVHNDVGLELLNIVTGQPLTQLSLEDGRDARHAVFVDINADRSIEKISANFDMKCQAEVSTIHPRPRAVFTAPLCESPFVWGGVSLSNLFSLSVDVANENTHVAVTPVVVKSISKTRGILNHLLGRSLESERKGYDSLFLTSTGRMSSYSPTGQPNWQVLLPISWSEIAFRTEIDPSFRTTDAGRMYMNYFHPSIKAMSLQLFGKQYSALVTGWDSIALVDLRDGYVLGHHSLPCQPIARPIVADFNRDGWNDFMIPCREGYISFTIQKGSRLVYTAVMAVAVVLSIALLVWCCRHSNHDYE